MIGDLANAMRLRGGESRQVTTFDLARRSKTVSVPQGRRVVVGDVRGAGTISRIWLTFPGWFWMHWHPEASLSISILKTLILRIYWDGSTTPAVEAPVGDFCGIGHAEYKPFLSLPLGMSSGGFYSYWPMPFRSGFRIELENRDPHIGTDVFLNVSYREGDAPPDDAGYLAAQFRTARCRPDESITVLDAAGRGQFVGLTLSMQGKPLNYLAFLEAPEQIAIDDDWDTPRIVGTGLEDYFNGGWYFREGEFAGPLHGAPLKDPLRSMVSMYRFHIDDPISFTRRIRMRFVNPWETERLRDYWYSSVAFYYGDRPDPEPVPLPDADGLLSMYRTRDQDHTSIP